MHEHPFKGNIHLIAKEARSKLHSPNLRAVLRRINEDATRLTERRVPGASGRIAALRVAESAIVGLMTSWRDERPGYKKKHWFYVASCTPSLHDGQMVYEKFWDYDLIEQHDRDEARICGYVYAGVQFRPYHDAMCGACGRCGMPCRYVGYCETEVDDDGNEHSVTEIGRLCLRCPEYSPFGYEFRKENFF